MTTKSDAASGAILGFDFDVEWYTVSSKASDYIGEAKAKQIVEQARPVPREFTPSSSWRWMTAVCFTRARCAAAGWNMSLKSMP